MPSLGSARHDVCACVRVPMCAREGESVVCVCVCVCVYDEGRGSGGGDKYHVVCVVRESG